jgi:hypothetical protein
MGKIDFNTKVTSNPFMIRELFTVPSSGMNGDRMGSYR